MGYEVIVDLLIDVALTGCSTSIKKLVVVFFIGLFEEKKCYFSPDGMGFGSMEIVVVKNEKL